MPNTTNLNLSLWQGTDVPNYATPNANYNKIDNAFGTLSAQVTENTSDIETFDGKVDTINTQIKDLYEADAELVKKITKNTEDINRNYTETQNNRSDISVLKTSVTNVAIRVSAPDYDYSTLDLNGNITHTKKSRSLYKSTVEFKGLTNSTEGVQIIRSQVGNGYYCYGTYTDLKIPLTSLFGIYDINNVNIANINIFSNSTETVNAVNPTVYKDTSDNNIYLKFDLMKTTFSLNSDWGFSEDMIYKIYIELTKG